MLLQQVRHTKLWLAGEAQNWPLANYEVEELGEGFDTFVEDHPTHDGSPVAPKDAIPRMITAPLAELRDAVQRKDSTLFVERYDAADRRVQRLSPGVERRIQPHSTARDESVS